MEGSVENVAGEGEKKGEQDGNVVDMYDSSNEVEKGYVLAISGDISVICKSVQRRARRSAPARGRCGNESMAENLGFFSNSRRARWKDRHRQEIVRRLMLPEMVVCLPEEENRRLRDQVAEYSSSRRTTGDRWAKKGKRKERDRVG